MLVVVLAVFGLAFVLLICTVAFIGVAAVAPRTYSLKRRLGVASGVVVAIIILALLFLLALVFHI